MWMRSRSVLPNAPSGRGLSAWRSTAVNTCRDPVGVVLGEPLRLGEGLGLPDDLVAHASAPPNTQRYASSCGTPALSPRAWRAR